MSEKIVFQARYKKGACMVRKDRLPDRLPYFAAGAVLHSMEVRSVGRLILDGEELEFQDIRVLVKPPAETSP